MKKTTTKVGIEEHGEFKMIESKTLFIHTIVSLLLIFGLGSRAFAYLQKDVEKTQEENHRQNIEMEKIISNYDSLNNDVKEHDKHIALSSQAFESMKGNLEDIKEILIQLLKQENKVK